MFPWDNKPSEPPQTPNDYTVKFDGIQNQLETLNRMLAQNVLPQLSPKPKKFLNVTLNAAAITFDSLGYTNFGIIVGASQTLTITLMGQNYNFSLNAGMNQLQLIDGTQLSSSTPFPCIFIWSDDILTNDNTAGTTTLTGSNFEGVPGTTAPAKVIAIGGKYTNGTIQALGTTTVQDSNGFLSGNTLATYSALAAYNENVSGGTWDRWRNNTQGTLLASSARTTTTPSSNQTNFNSKGIMLFLNITAVPASPGTGGLDVVIIGIDPVSGNAIQINLNHAKLTTIGLYSIQLYPGVSGTSGTGPSAIIQATNDALPRVWFSRVNHGDAQSYTYSLGYALIL